MHCVFSIVAHVSVMATSLEIVARFRNFSEALTDWVTIPWDTKVGTLAVIRDVDGRTTTFDLHFHIAVLEDSSDNDGDDVKPASATSEGEEMSVASALEESNEWSAEERTPR